MINGTEDKTKAILVGVVNSAEDQESLDELALLAEAAGVSVAGKVTQRKDRIDPAYYIGRGKVQEIKLMADELGANTVIFDDELSPMQKRNLENMIGIQIIDRTMLILDIFAQRARSMEGKIQVELAQLQYLLPRLTGKGIELSREGGGIGTRGLGETKLETDRRHIRRRISCLKRELEEVKKNRGLIRKARKFPVVSLVGYTNAGKSTLLNVLTGSNVSSNNRLFDTLDTTTRGLVLPDGRTVLVSDTVGFIKKLPHQLVEAFKATLDEVREADLLIHVVDGSSPRMDEEIATVNEVLKEIGASGRPTINAINKIDKISGDFTIGSRSMVKISALKGINIDTLINMIAEFLPSERERAHLVIPYTEAGILDEVHKHGVITREEYTPGGIKIVGEIDMALLGRLKKYERD
ncbi:MAG: GTPase HflX [Thermoanaerobacteraceae bacterium]|nr:GTPase HflX [Thermoanaerobacteraceae bacterium]